MTTLNLEGTPLYREIEEAIAHKTNSNKKSRELVAQIREWANRLDFSDNDKSKTQAKALKDLNLILTKFFTNPTSKQVPGPNYAVLSDIAKEQRLSFRTLRRWVDLYKLPIFHFKQGRVLSGTGPGYLTVIRQEDVETLLARHRAKNMSTSSETASELPEKAPELPEKTPELPEKTPELPEKTQRKSKKPQYAYVGICPVTNEIRWFAKSKTENFVKAWSLGRRGRHVYSLKDNWIVAHNLLEDMNFFQRAAYLDKHAKRVDLGKVKK